MAYNIEGLTKKQVTLLDIMWTLEEEKDVQNFIRSLPPKDRQDAVSLMTLLTHEIMEEFLDGVTEFPDAHAVIERVR